MSPQHLISTYSEQFVPPGGGKPAVPRLSSPSRRNNPHPRPLEVTKGISKRSSFRGPTLIPSSQIPVLSRQMSASNSQRRLQSTNSPAAQHNHKPQPYWRSNTLDSCAGYSCFNVVKPFQAGHFIIHPEFVSENLRPAHFGNINNKCY
ncbi:unnamed protein product [Boreogadus saida]